MIYIHAKEAKLLLFAAQGLNTQQISEAMHYSIDHTKRLRALVIYRLSAKNLTQAVAIAYELGVLAKPNVRLNGGVNTAWTIVD